MLKLYAHKLRACTKTCAAKYLKADEPRTTASDEVKIRMQSKIHTGAYIHLASFVRVKVGLQHEIVIEMQSATMVWI